MENFGIFSTAMDSYMTTGSVDLGNVAISAVVGAISGGIAATGLSAIAQASITAVASAIGSVATDVYDRGKRNDVSKVTLKECGQIAMRATASAVIGFGSSIAGSAFGNGMTKGLNKRADDMIFKGKHKIGYMTKAQSRNLVSKGKCLKNTAYGASSVIGTVITWPSVTVISGSVLSTWT